MTKDNYIDIAKKIVKEKYGNCHGALMAGSIVRGQATERSDIDLIIYHDKISKAYRESYYYEGVPIEVFVHSKTSFDYFFKYDCNRKMPSLPLMVLESEIIKDCHYFAFLKEKAKEIYLSGPGKLSKDELDFKRYFITDLKDDLIGSKDEFEILLIVNALLVKLHEFYLLSKNQWIGQGKWIKRSLAKYDSDFAIRFEEASLNFYSLRDKSIIIDLIDEILLPYGGDYFQGFSLGKD
jgi:predicted nucleotidyltransferase